MTAAELANCLQYASDNRTRAQLGALAVELMPAIINHLEQLGIEESNDGSMCRDPVDAEVVAAYAAGGITHYSKLQAVARLLRHARKEKHDEMAQQTDRPNLR